MNTLHPYNVIYISYITYTISIHVSIKYLMYSLLYISSCKPSCSEKIMYISLTPLQNGLSVNIVLFCSVLGMRMVKEDYLGLNDQLVLAVSHSTFDPFIYLEERSSTSV